MEMDADDMPKLRAAEERCRLVVETARALVHYFSIDGTIIYANRFAEEVTGYSREELIGKNFIDVYVREQDREEMIQDLEPVLHGRPIENCEMPMVMKDGSIRVMLWSGACTFDPDGRPNGVVASALDISDLKHTEEALRESEEKYRTLVDHSLAGVFIVQDGRFVFANKPAEELAGYTLEEFKHRDYWELVHPADREFVKDRAERRLRGEHVPERYDYRMLTRSGEARTVEIWATLIDYGGRKAILANVVDITDRKKAEDTRLQAERDLERQKRQFCRDAIATLTHGRLDVVELEEIEEALRDATVTVEVKQPKDVRLARHLVRELATDAGLEGERLEEFLLGVGEAAVNAVKHASGGTVRAGVSDGIVRVGVVDHGPGMDSLVLTRAVLGRGFSTKPSLGLGYTFILCGSDHVLLATSPQGTAVVMEKQVAAPEPAGPVDVAGIPCSW